MSELTVSVVVPTYQRPALLARCLTALLLQDFDASRCEIIIADDAASELTRQQVESAAACSAIPLRYVAVTKAHGPAAARNAGWQAAQGALIAFTDDDTQPASNWLSAGVSAFDDPEVAGAWGRIIVPLGDNPTDYERDAAGLAEAPFATANSFYRRAALREAGGFDERFRLAWREDSDLHFTLLERGKRLVRVEQAVVWHPVRPAAWGVSLSQQRKSLYDPLLYRKHPALYRAQIAPFPRDYYAMNAALALALFGLLRQHRNTAGAAWLMYGWLAGRFCWRRLRGNALTPKHVAEMVVTSALIPPLALYWRVRGLARFRTWYI